MGFKNISIGIVMLFAVVVLLFIGFLFWRASSHIEEPIKENPKEENTIQQVSRMSIEPEQMGSKQEDAMIEQQLDRDRQQQKQTKDLRIKLEQTNLELEEEKALSEISKLKKENTAPLNESSADGQKNLPEIKVNYIGGDNLKKEAIISIAGTDYQVKENSNPTADIQVMSISNLGVTLRFNTPEKLIKTFEYKPE